MSEIVHQPAELPEITHQVGFTAVDASIDRLQERFPFAYDFIQFLSSARASEHGSTTDAKTASNPTAPDISRTRASSDMSDKTIAANPAKKNRTATSLETITEPEDPDLTVARMTHQFIRGSYQKMPAGIRRKWQRQLPTELVEMNLAHVVRRLQVGIEPGQSTSAIKQMQYKDTLLNWRSITQREVPQNRYPEMMAASKLAQQLRRAGETALMRPVELLLSVYGGTYLHLSPEQKALPHEYYEEIRRRKDPFASNWEREMVFDDYETKESVIIVYTGENKGKTSAAVGLMARALGNRWNVAFIQFIKYWGVGEHVFIRDVMPIYKDHLFFYKGGKGFYNAGDLSPAAISDDQHKQAAQQTFDEALACATSGDYDLVICDEINNAVHDGLLQQAQLETLITTKAPRTSLCLTGRDFPKKLLDKVDIATEMTKLKHHFDDKFLANKGIDF